MANLLSSLQAASFNLGAFGQALAVVQNNVGNATTPGYARQRVFLQALPFVQTGGLSGGVAVDRIESMRDRFLDFQVVSALQQKTYFEKLSQTLTQIEPNFPISGNLSIGSAVDGLLHSFQALSTSPGDSTLRQQVLTSARGVATAIRTAYSGLTGQRATLDQEAVWVVSRINTLSAEISKLNQALLQPGLVSDKSALETRLTQVLEELGTLVDYRLITQQDGQLGVVLSGGTPLVSGVFAFPLQAFATGPRLEIREPQGADVSATIEAGQLGALLAARNSLLPNYLAQLDQVAATLADSVNAQLAAGRDLSGIAGKPLFQYTSLAFTGAGRSAGTTGAATPFPPVSVSVTFSGGVTGAITANLDSFFVAGAPPAGLSSGDTITVTLASADQTIRGSITTVPLSAGDTTAVLAARLNDQVALHPDLAGRVTFIDEGGLLKIVESDTVGQGLIFTASTSNPAFTTGLEPGGVLGGHSAEEIAAALNAQVALNQTLLDAGVRFTAAGGEIRVDANVSFSATVTDSPQGTGFASGLAGSFTAGGSPAAATFAVTNLSIREIAAASPGAPRGNGNALALAALASKPVVGGFTFNQFYGRLVSRVGDDAAQTGAAFLTQQQILTESQNIRDSFSGVSLDEEAARLLEFQRAYEATARVITVLDSLAAEVIALVR
jgi:flagellar hook-associated protein 1 FlgK